MCALASVRASDVRASDFLKALLFESVTLLEGVRLFRSFGLLNGFIILKCGKFLEGI